MGRPGGAPSRRPRTRTAATVLARRVSPSPPWWTPSVIRSRLVGCPATPGLARRPGQPGWVLRPVPHEPRLQNPPGRTPRKLLDIMHRTAPHPGLGYIQPFNDFGFAPAPLFKTAVHKQITARAQGGRGRSDPRGGDEVSDAVYWRSYIRPTNWIRTRPGCRDGLLVGVGPGVDHQLHAGCLRVGAVLLRPDGREPQPSAAEAIRGGPYVPRTFPLLPVLAGAPTKRPPHDGFDDHPTCPTEPPCAVCAPPPTD
ncbi:hypothetical protein RKD20_009334 [Streptomyces sp. SLBN-8D4]